MTSCIGVFTIFALWVVSCLASVIWGMHLHSIGITPDTMIAKAREKILSWLK